MATIVTNGYNGKCLGLDVWETGNYNSGNSTREYGWHLYGTGGSSYHMAGNFSASVGGVHVYGSAGRIQLYNGTTVASGTVWVQHDGAGNKYVDMYCEAGIYNVAVNCRASGGFWGANIPRYTSITGFSVAKRDETSVTISVSASDATDLAWYSKDNGGSWANLPSGGVVTGLSANTGYNFKVRVRRTDSQLTTDSWTVYQATHPYPSINSAPAFTIGNSLTIGITNPLKRSCTVHIIGDNGSSKASSATTGTSIAGFNDSAWKTFLYRTLPKKSSATYKVRLVVSSPARDTTINGGTYSVKGNNAEAPTFTDFNWQDTDTLAAGLTGKTGASNPTVLVKGMSDVTFKIPTAKKMSSSFGADLNYYNCAWGGSASNNVNYSTSAEVSAKVENGTADSIAVTGYDHRGQYKTVTKSGLTIISPSIASCELSADRRNGVEATTYLNGLFRYWSGDWAGGSSRPNELFKITMQVNGGTAIDITSKVTANSVSSKSGNITILTLNKNALQIHANTAQTGGFTVGTSYTLTFKIYTGFSTSFYYDNNRSIGTAVVPDGKIGIARYKDSSGNYHYGINGMPDATYAEKVYGAVDVEGALYINGVKMIWYE